MTQIDAKLAVLRPADAIAAARCLAVRTRPAQSASLYVAGINARNHPKPCAWEDWPTDDLAVLLVRFNDEAGWNPERDTYTDPAVNLFRRLPANEQARLVEQSQYPTEAA